MYTFREIGFETKIETFRFVKDFITSYKSTFYNINREYKEKMANILKKYPYLKDRKDVNAIQAIKDNTEDLTKLNDKIMNTMDFQIYLRNLSSYAELGETLLSNTTNYLNQNDGYEFNYFILTIISKTFDVYLEYFGNLEEKLYELCDKSYSIS